MEYRLLVFLFVIQFGNLQAGDLQKYNIKVNADCSGNSLQTVNSLALEACDDRCMDTSGCKGFVYDNGNSQCILKRSCTNFLTSDSRDFYTVDNHVCEWQPAASCSNTFEYESKTYQGCSYDGEVTDPWCEMTSTQCTKTCQKHDLAFQYGAALTVYNRGFYDTVDVATSYQMIFVDIFGRSGLMTKLNLDVAEINRELAIGIFRNTGVGTCDLTLIREISLHDNPSYQEYLQHYGVQQIKLEIEDFLPVTPNYHLGLYWGGQGTLYGTADGMQLGYQMCGYDLQKSTHVRFVPYEIQSSTGMFTRHYSLDMVLQQSDTDLNWMLNAALYRTTVIDGVTYSHRDGTLVITDGDYSTCQSTSSGLIEVDMDKLVGIKLVKLRATGDITFTVTVKRSHDDTSSQNCGTFPSDHMTSGSGSLSCTDTAVGRYLTITVESDSTICEVEVIITHLADTCLSDDCYYVTGQLVDSAGSGQEECQRHYASATMFQPRNQEHWDQVAQWYQQLTFADNFTDAAVGMKYSGGSWEIQSTSAPVPSLDWGESPGTFNYAILDYTTGKPTPASSGRPHYALCQVPKSVVEASVKTLFRASAGCNENLYNLWTGNSITPQVTDSFSPALISTSSSDSGVYKSPIIKCNTFSSMKEVRLSLYKDNTEVAYAVFTSDTTVENWFTMAHLKGSSYHDLPVPVNSQANYASMFGDTLGGANHRWYLNSQTYGCENSGWMAVLDLGHESTCDWDSLDGQDAPQFIYSNQGSFSSNWLKADVFVITGRFEQSSFGGQCVDNCEGLSDGDYQSCLGCNVYSKCDNQILTYYTCRHGLQFDSEASDCVEESTTCTGGNAQKSCETGCPNPDPCSQGNCVYHSAESGLDGWDCECQTGYTGALCDGNIDDCEDDSCNNHGDCNDLVNDFSCSCHGGYTGDFCEKVDYCYQNEECQNGGVCEDHNTDFSCDCTVEYFGEHCQYTDECVTLSLNCTGHGECLRQQSGWLCNCSEGFVGPQCEFEDSCLKEDCDKVEGSTCHLTTDYLNYYCVCQNGKIGDSCTETNPCRNSPCEHGTCGIVGWPPAGYSYVCDCEGSYWSGDTCSLGPCDRSTLCEHLGTCTNVPSDPDGFTCDCLHWFEGKNCSVEKPIADSDEQVLTVDDESGGGMSMNSIIGLVVGLLLVVAVVLIVIVAVRKYRQKKVEDRRQQELEKATYKIRTKDSPSTFQYWTGEGAQNYHLANKDRYILTPHY